MLYNVEFFRFIFTIAVLLGHAQSIHLSEQIIASKYVANSGFCVELFLIIAGYFLYKEIKKDETIKTFCLKKIFRLIPVVIFGYLLHIIAYKTEIIQQKFHFKNEFLNLLFIREIGINNYGIVPLQNNLRSTNVFAWYLGPLFYVSLFYFYILKNFDKKKVHFTMVLMIYLSMAFCFRNILHDFNYTFRAIYSIGIGYFLGMFVEWYKNNSKNINTTRSKIIFTIIEIICCNELFRIIFKKFYHQDLNLYFMIIFCILMFSFIFEKGYLGKFLNKKTFGFMGKYCYSIYMVQYIVQNTIGIGNKLMNWAVYAGFRQNYPNTELLCTLVFTVLFGVLTYYCVEQPAKKYLEKKFLN